MMIQLKKEGFIQGDEVVAHTFVFFIAAFETTSSTMVLCLYELSKNRKLQRRVQKEIDAVLNGSSVDTVSFEMLSDLNLLECCIYETLRKYPPAPFLIRECTKDYKIPDENCTIPEGTPIIISTFGLHRDANIYEDPSEFKPERFLNSPTGGGNSKGSFYLPFGHGPRICIGEKNFLLRIEIN